MSEPALKCENNCAIFKQIFTQKLFTSFKMPYSRYFGYRGNLEFSDFIQKKFCNINYWPYYTKISEISNSMGLAYTCDSVNKIEH